MDEEEKVKVKEESKESLPKGPKRLLKDTVKETAKEAVGEVVGKVIEEDESSKNEITEDLTKRETVLNKNLGLSLEKLEGEIRSGFRTTEYMDKEYHICLPSIKDDEILSKYKSKIAAEVLKDKDVVLKDEVIKNLRERGIWDDSKDKKERELRDRYAKCLSDLYLEKARENPAPERIEELKRERISLDIDIALLTETKNYFVNTAAESRIEERVLMHKTVLCIKDAENKRLWNSVEELENCTEKALVNTLTSEAIYFWAGVDPSMFDFTLR